MSRMISITVTASTGVGKSTIAELIYQTLAKAGIDVDIKDDNVYGVVEEFPGVVAESLDSRIESIKDYGTSVVVQTMRSMREM